MRWSKPNRIPVFLLGLIALPLLITLAAQAWQWHLKTEPLQRQQHKALQTMRLKESSITWEEEGRELVLDGRYFDVAESCRQGEYLLLTGYYDEEETLLVALLQKIGHHTKSPQALSRLILLLQCFVVFPSFAFPAVSPLLQTSFGSLPFTNYSDPLLQRLFHPPR